MAIRLKVWWSRARDSLWFTPGLMTALAALLAFATTRVDIALLSDNRTAVLWTFGGGAEGARGVLGAVASGIITVTGVVFSVTIVALQLASSQFTPRILRNFMSDRANQLVLGVFIGTFAYTLLVLRVVRSDADGVSAFVPSLSVTVAIVLTLVSIGFLIFYIDYTARSIQAWSMINRSAAETAKRLEEIFPRNIGRPADRPLDTGAGLPNEDGHPIATPDAGYLQAIDTEALFRIGKRGRHTVRMETEIGQFLMPGASIASLWPSDASGEVIEDVRKAFIVDRREPPDDTLSFGVTQLADIAIKALSPGINDPTTALRSIDRLGEIIARHARMDVPSQYRTDGDGKLLFITCQPDLRRIIALSFGAIRHYGSGNPDVAVHLLRTLGNMARVIPADRRAHVEIEACRVLLDARRSIKSPADLADVEHAAEWLPDNDLALRLAA